MRLADVLARPDLRLVLLTGQDRLDRPVGWVFTTDLLDPRRYLAGGEIVLTGLMWRRTPADSETFVASLVAAGVAALGAGDAALGSVPADLVDACRRHGLPLFEVPVDVSFRTIADEVLPSLWAERATSLAAALGRHRGTVAAFTDGDALDPLLRAVAGDLGVDCWVLSPTGRVLAGTADLAGSLAARLAHAYLSVDRLPHTVVVDRVRHITLDAVRGRAPRLAGWCLACEGAVDGAHRLREYASELAAVAALERTRRQEARRVERRLGTAVLDRLAGAEADAAVASALRMCALPTDAGFVAIVSTVDSAGDRRERFQYVGADRPEPDRTSGADQPGLSHAVGRTSGADQPGLSHAVGRTSGADRSELSHAVLDELIAPLAQPVATGDVPAGRSGDLHPATPGPGAVARGLSGCRPAAPDDPADDRAAAALIPIGSDAAAGLMERVRANADAMAPGVSRLTVGVSDPATAADARSALADARYAYRVAQTRPGRVAVVCGADLASHVPLLAGLPGGTRDAYRQRVLGPLLAYDAAHRAGLLETLAAFLAASGSWTRCARLLHVHVNTLRYRIRRIEALTGRNLSALADQVDLVLALRLPPDPVRAAAATIPPAASGPEPAPAAARRAAGPAPAAAMPVAAPGPPRSTGRPRSTGPAQPDGGDCGAPCGCHAGCGYPGCGYAACGYPCGGGPAGGYGAWR